MTVGFGAAQPYTKLMGLNTTWAITNMGVNGQLLHGALGMIGTAPTRIDPLFNPIAPKNVVILWGGTNDIFLGAAPSQVYADMQTYCADRHAVGWKCIATTMISRVTVDAQKNVLNALILADHSWADGLVDFTGTNLGCDGCYSNLTYFQADQTHPTQFGITTIEAPAFSTVLNSLP